MITHRDHLSRGAKEQAAQLRNYWWSAQEQTRKCKEANLRRGKRAKSASKGPGKRKKKDDILNKVQQEGNGEIETKKEGAMEGRGSTSGSNKDGW